MAAFHLRKKSFIVPALSLFVCTFLSCQKLNKEASENVRVLSRGWYIHSSSGIELNGETVSSAEVDLNGWYPTDVPSTVLAALVKNGLYKNLFFGKNLKTLTKKPFQDPWWYRKEFSLGSRLEFENIRLILEGINYRANIWLNGKKIVDSDSIRGAFRMFDIDISDYINSKKNILAIEVFPPKPGDFTIGFVDWNPRPPDENMGIWRGVKLRLSGAVSVNNPFVQSQVNLENFGNAALTVKADLINHTDKKASGILKGEIEEIQFIQPYELEAHERKQLTFSPEVYEELNFKKPELWWPNNLGKPHLFPLKMTVFVNGIISDTQITKFGIRDVSDYINEEGHRGYKINGKKVLIRGGGWVDDIFLVEDPKKLEAQIKYAKHMNLNAIRLEGFWGSSQQIYDLADKYGILVMPGLSCQWEWEGHLGKPVDEFMGVETPEEIELVSRSYQDQVVWLRNHPSIFVWIYGSDKLPRPALEKKLNEYLARVDTSRPILGACKYKLYGGNFLISEISGQTLVKMNGPYDYVTPNYWYVDKNYGGAFGFNTETGPGPQPPPLESLKKMIPEDHLWPINEYWDFHCSRNKFNTLERYLNAFNHRYGTVENVEEFAWKAQAANYEAIRAMFEAFGVNKHNATGIIQWMLNSAWPGMFWQLYDYYLMPSGAFYGTRTASEPVNIIYNYGNKDIYIVNDTISSVEDLIAEVRVLNLDSEVVFSKDIQTSIEENMSKKLLSLPEIDNLTSVYFMDLKLKAADGKVFSDNFYWLSTKEDVLDEKNTTWFVTPNKEFANFTALNYLTEVEISAKHQFKDLGEEQEIRVTLENPSDKIAFFIELNVFGKESGNSILPIFWSDNYVSLLPGEVKEFHAHFSKEDLKGEEPGFKYNGWNVKEIIQ